MTLPLYFPTLVLLGGAVLMGLAGGRLPLRFRGWIALSFTLAALAGFALDVPVLLKSGPLETNLGQWDQGVPLVLRLDGLSLIAGLAACFLAALAWLDMAIKPEPFPAAVVPLGLGVQGGLAALFSFSCLPLAYLGWSLLGLCAAGLVAAALPAREGQASHPGLKTLLMTTLPGLCFLAAVMLLDSRADSFLWNAESTAKAAGSGIFILLLCAAMSRALVYPLHTWGQEAARLPAPLQVLVLNAGLVPSGLYLAARSITLFSWSSAWAYAALALGCLTCLLGAMGAWGDPDPSRRLVHLVSAQSGIVLAGLGINTGLGAAAALFGWIALGVSGSALILLNPARRSLPVKIAWIVLGMGLPLTGTFVAFWLLLDAAVAAGLYLAAFVLGLGGVILSLAVLRMAFQAGAEEEKTAPTIWSGLVAGIAALGLGIVPQGVVVALVEPALRSLHYSREVEISWLGSQFNASGLRLGAGLWLALLVPLAAYVASCWLRENPGGSLLAAADPDPLYRWGWKQIKAAVARLEQWVSPRLWARPSYAWAVLAVFLGAAWVFAVQIPDFLFTYQPLLSGLAVLCLIGGSLLALAAPRFSHLLAYGCVYALGGVLAALSAGPGPGWSAARLGAVNIVLSAGLLYVGQDALEKYGKRPLGLAALICGGLSLCGLPPFFGYAAHWRLVLAAAGSSTWLLAVLVLADGLALLAFARAVFVWREAPKEGARLSFFLKLAIPGLIIVLLVLGLYPALVSMRL